MVYFYFKVLTILAGIHDVLYILILLFESVKKKGIEKGAFSIFF